MPHSAGRSFAVVEVPPYGQPGHLARVEERGVHAMRLADRYDWFVATPVYLLIDEGVVVGVQEQSGEMVLIPDS